MATDATYDLTVRHVVAEVPWRGALLLRQPLYNKGTAFSHAERRLFGLEGLLPDAVSTQAQQATRAYANIARKHDPLERYIGMAALQDRNEHLYYRVLLDHLDELLPIVYTPTVGRACQDYSHIFRRGRGIWITPAHRGRVAEVLGNAPNGDVRLVVVTDNERILGLGDQGAGGMGIPVGKLALYTAAAGIHPANTLPVSLDVGTDNRTLLEDELYLGWRRPRLRGPEYEALVEEFVQAVRGRFPRALLQWEDFKKGIAFRLLDRYRKVLPSFNDDIQGTAAVTLAAVLAAERLTGTPLAAERFLVLGAGAAGVGIAQLLRTALRATGQGEGDVASAVVLLDSRGLLVDDGRISDAYKVPFAWSADRAAAHGLHAGSGLLETVRAVRPTVLVGTSGEPRVFTEEVVRAMAGGTSRPVVMPLSNPTSQAEATPEDLMRWTDGRALVATGSPFPPVRAGGREVQVGQANNVFVFPAIGLAAIAGAVSEVSEGMFAAAARALAGRVRDADLDGGRLLPPVSDLRSVTETVACAVLQQARAEGVAQEDGRAPAEVIASAMWWPDYPILTPSS
jgi:malic enzyme